MIQSKEIQLFPKGLPCLSFLSDAISLIHTGILAICPYPIPAVAGKSYLVITCNSCVQFVELVSAVSPNSPSLTNTMDMSLPDPSAKLAEIHPTSEALASTFSSITTGEWTCQVCQTVYTADDQGCTSCGVARPSVVHFSVRRIKSGKRAFIQLKWKAKDADEVLLDAHPYPLPIEGELEVDDPRGGTFHLMARNGIGSVQATTHIQELAPVIKRFEASDDTISLGYPLIFSWEALYADKLIIKGLGEVTERTFAEVYLNKPGEYELIATNSSGSASAKVTLGLPKPEIQSFFASSYVIRPEYPITLFWEVSQAEEVILLPHEEPVTDLSKIDVIPDRTTTYTLIAKNASGEARGDITLELPEPVIHHFGGDSFSDQGEPINLEWAVSNAYEVQISPHIGEVAAEGHTRTRPKEPYTTYRLTAKGHSGTAYAEFQVVRFPIPIDMPDLDRQFNSLIAMANPTTQKGKAKDPSSPDPSMPTDKQASAKTNRRAPFTDSKSDLQRAQQMFLSEDMLNVKRGHVRKELRTALHKIRLLIKDKLNR